MTEKELILYLLKKGLFPKFEKNFMDFLIHEIISLKRIDDTYFQFVESNANVNIITSILNIEEVKKFVNSLLIKYFNKKAIEDKKYPFLSLNDDTEDLNRQQILKKYPINNEDVNNFFFLLKQSQSDFRDVIDLDKEISNFISNKDIERKKVEYLYDHFFVNSENWNITLKNLEQHINTDIINHNNLILLGLSFKDKDYYKILDKYTSINFNENCKFNIIDSKKLISNQGISLKFEKSKFESKLEHIFCKSLMFIECEISEYYYKNNSEDKVVINELIFENTKINKLELKGVEINSQVFKNNDDMKDEYKTIESLVLNNCKLNKNLCLDLSNRENKKDYVRFKIINLDVTNSEFNKGKNAKVKIQFCDIEKGIFYNTKFQDLADFYQTKFNEVNFERTDFEKVSVFSEVIFNCDVDFKYTKFFGKSIFRDTVITGKLNLRNTIFNDEANFLDITKEKRKQKDNEFYGEVKDIEVSNRETARIIKNFYDNSNNVIEANRFYKLEMKKRKEELSYGKGIFLNDNHFLERIVFLFHRYSSNHSQSWALPLFLILMLGMAYSLIEYEYFLNFKDKHDIYLKYPIDKENFLHAFYFSILFMTTIGFIWMKHISNFLFTILWLFYGVYIYITVDIYLSLVAKAINPFSVMKNIEPINGLELLFKVVISYLLYQLIISVRQNTRRK